MSNNNPNNMDNNMVHAAAHIVVIIVVHFDLDLVEVVEILCLC
jgi:hypothetical protein